jgi:hypothetical protein
MIRVVIHPLPREFPILHNVKLAPQPGTGIIGIVLIIHFQNFSTHHQMLLPIEFALIAINTTDRIIHIPNIHTIIREIGSETIHRSRDFFVSI